MVVDGDVCSVYSWYDNEFGYTKSAASSRYSIRRLCSIA
jgi:glyceraldehyde-3-phosphate dehydrogenase/erythrose-4-phosphate dehydrogenase